MRLNRIILVVLVVLSISCVRKPERSLIGEWKGTDSGGQTLLFVLNSDRTCKTIQGNVVLDSQTVGGEMEWRADVSRDPMTLDFVITSAFGDQRVLPMIFRFVTDQTIQIRTTDDFQSRPTGFSAEDTKNQIVLNKQ